jgi:hypothetical protein
MDGVAFAETVFFEIERSLPLVNPENGPPPGVDMASYSIVEK